MVTAVKQQYLRQLPAVDKILQDKALDAIRDDVPRSLLTKTIQEVIAGKRELIRKALSEEELELLDISVPTIIKEVIARVKDKIMLHLRPVLNATGVLLHTNLGRAPLPLSAVKALQEVAGSYSNLEFSLQTGRRASRSEHVEELLCRLTGAEGALVVNNNAGAVFLALNTLAAGKEVIVSRGELVEIGGSFRIPEVMSRSGAKLVEVGTTNKCYLKDYKKAINNRTALLLKVHTSNYKIVGFTAEVPLPSLVKLGREHRLPVMEDLGSGVLVDLRNYGLHYEPTVQDSIAAGADIITFSGDKLLGGPQAGLIVGRKKYIDLIKGNQLLRALRVDKLKLVTLEATLRLYLEEKKAVREIPILKMLTLSAGELKKRAEKMAAVLEGKLAGKKLGSKYKVGISEEKARVGGGSLPLAALASYQVFIEPAAINAGALAAKLRKASIPVIARVKKNRLLLDLRTVREEDDETLLRILLETLAGSNY